LSRASINLNLKEVDIEKIKKTNTKQNEEIKNKEKIINEYQILKAKMLIDMDNMKNKLSKKPYLIGV
jgi:hypothetical protein